MNNNKKNLKTADSLGAVTPSVVYENPDLQKKDILMKIKGNQVYIVGLIK
jgi:hypothetical protein